MKLWEGLEQDLNFNAMVTQRGVLNLFHSDAQRDAFARRGNAMRINGVDAELLDREAVREMYPFFDFDNARFPIQGGLLQRRGGTVRHDAVAWGYARGADQRGVDIIQNCEVTGIRIENGRVAGVETTRGFIGAKKVGIAVAGNSSAGGGAWPGMRLPIESHVLQAFVTEGLKPVIDHVVTFGAGHFYISQSDKGGLVFGGDIDGYNSYAQRGNLPMVEHVIEARHGADARSSAALRVLRHLGRHHGHVAWTARPIIDKTPDRRPLSQRRLVLRRLQGDAGLGLVLRASDRQGRAASSSTPPIASTASQGLHDRRKRHRAPQPEPALRTQAHDASPCPHCGERDRVEEFSYPRRCRRLMRPAAERPAADGPVARLRLSARQPGGPHRRTLAARAGLPRLAGGDAQHRHA